MSAKIDGDDLFRQVMGTTQVQSAVYKEAVRIAAKARRLDASEGKGTATIKVERIPIANGRAAYNVTSDDVSGEYGTSEAKRLRTLRRAAKGA
ncbi:hypothetical protein [Corynebacterium mastitidis]|uniref:hypothetical protein n=1 Tax=Corynebacterium mastitidis TaxID=161890 RepID=UPI0012EABF04|nr:hypothetical protein [Corynebacterium mastitidis]